MTRPHPDVLPPLIAHRGNAADFPENTLEALQSAVELGLKHVEFDVQLTADAVPVVLHDSDLQRVAGRPDCVHDLAWPALAGIPITEPQRFGDRFVDVRAPSLARVVESLRQWRDVTGFVEVKRASVRRFGREAVLKRIAADVAPALEHCVLISFDLASVRLLRAMTGARIGWVIEQYDEPTRRLATEAGPDFLFANLERIPVTTTELWPGGWQWAIYEIRDAATARHCAGLGAKFVETMNVREMLEAYVRTAVP
ncbi:MAG TPA: glycerophosphodiester phosphodiesterase family protein [Steroidobacteraceae bacterium]|nr:glycerophosphodiester phosphodiesterase family protein [Steroidobacteraceae bacterium]